MSALPPELAERGWALIEDEALATLAALPSRSVDAVITDPPYGIGFAGHGWDGRELGFHGKNDWPSGELFARWTCAWAAECRRVLKPGGWLLAFGAPRMAHRTAAGIEEAGFELRDQLLWLYGSGVPKQGLDDQGRSGCLKPAYEPIVLARAPLAGQSAAENAAKFGTGLLRIDEARIARVEGGLGRWPANVALSHSDTCRSSRCASDCPVALLDRSRPGSRPSRFFYCPKPSRDERDAGCEALPLRRVQTYGSGALRRNAHPTVKPVALMRWLVRLASPPGGLVLDPFAGSGSTGVACLAEGRRFLGIERDPGYMRIARARLAQQGSLDPDVEELRAA